MTTKTDETEGNQFASWVTISSKGQVAIPINIRKELNLKIGDRLLIIIRKDKDGINLIKSDSLNEVFSKFTK